MKRTDMVIVFPIVGLKRRVYERNGIEYIRVRDCLASVEEVEQHLMDNLAIKDGDTLSYRMYTG